MPNISSLAGLEVGEKFVVVVVGWGGAYLVYPYPKKNQYTFINSIVDLVYPKQKHLASI